MDFYWRATSSGRTFPWTRTKLLGLFLASVCVLLSPLRPLLAQTNQYSSSTLGMDPDLHAKLQNQGSLELRDTSLDQALLTIGKIWNVDLVFGKDIQGQVSTIFHDKPLHEILDAILHVNDYSYQILGKSIVVKKLDVSGQINPMFHPTTISLRTIKPEDILKSVEYMTSPQGKVEAIPSARSLLVWDFPERVERIREFVERLDQTAASVNGTTIGSQDQLEVAHFSPQFIEAKSLKEAVQAILSQDGKLAVLENENRLIVYDHPSRIRLIRKLIQQIDICPPQVRITALIYDISLEDMEQLGLNWNHAVKGRNLDANGDAQDVFSIDSLLQIPAQVGDPSGAITFMSLNRNFDITAVIQALQSARDSRLLADPTVTVVDRQQAMIKIVSAIPFQQLTQTSQGGSIGTTAFREAGVKLSVFPKIANDGTIEMLIKPSFSRLAGFTSDTQPQPIIDTREAETTVRVANKQTLVIGGLRQRTDIGNFRGIPFLKDIKTFRLGELFRSRETTVRESELVVFITPEIIRGNEFSRERQIDAHDTGQRLLGDIPFASQVDTPYCNRCAEPVISTSPEIHQAKIPLPTRVQHSIERTPILQTYSPKPSFPTSRPSFNSAKYLSLDSRNYFPKKSPTVQTPALPGYSLRKNQKSSLGLLPTPKSIFSQLSRSRPAISRIPLVEVR